MGRLGSGLGAVLGPSWEVLGVLGLALARLGASCGLSARLGRPVCEPVWEADPSERQADRSVSQSGANRNSIGQQLRRSGLENCLYDMYIENVLNMYRTRSENILKTVLLRPGP